MGDMADMMLDGTLCAACGVYETVIWKYGDLAFCDDCRDDPVVKKSWGLPKKSAPVWRREDRSADEVYPKKQGREKTCC